MGWPENYADVNCTTLFHCMTAHEVWFLLAGNANCSFDLAAYVLLLAGSCHWKCI